ncbi:hypothetical protein CGRA01v4_07386 [Colletotrichum graminicola]|nr:hypothetical protein CGRA01v4_07386 [Colletotrichum graminicola]
MTMVFSFTSLGGVESEAEGHGTNRERIYEQQLLNYIGPKSGRETMFIVMVAARQVKLSSRKEEPTCTIQAVPCLGIPLSKLSRDFVKGRVRRKDSSAWQMRFPVWLTWYTVRHRMVHKRASHLDTYSVTVNAAQEP